MEKMPQNVFLPGRRSGFEQPTPAGVVLALHTIRRQHQIECTAQHPGVISLRAPDKFPDRHTGQSDVRCTGKQMPGMFSGQQETQDDDDHGPRKTTYVIAETSATCSET